MIHISSIKDCSDTAYIENFCHYPRKVYMTNNSISRLKISMQAVKPLMNEMESSKINTTFRIALGRIERMAKYTGGVHIS